MGGEEGGEEDLDGEEGAKGKKGKQGSSFKISDMDEWDGSDDGLDTDEEKEKKQDDSDSDGGKKKKKKKNHDVDEAFEDSDDGDDEGREVDYMSDESSESDEEVTKEHDVKGVDQDEGLSKMLDSDSSSSDEDKKKSDDDDDDEDETGKKKKKGGNSDDEGNKKKKGGSAASSRSGTPTKEMEKMDKDQKRKAMVAGLLDPNASNESNAKKSRLEQFGGSSAGSSGSIAGTEAITDEAVRRYLKRRPMTTTDLLKKFRSKKTGIMNAQLVQLLANILKKINPHKQKVKGVTYLSLKEGQ